MSCFPVLVRSVSPLGEVRYSLGDPLVDSYLEFVAGRCRPNTLRAVTLDVKVFFSVVTKDPVAVAPPDVFEFLAYQRGDRTVVRMSDRESGLAARTIARRLSSISGFYAYLLARGDTPVRASPVPRGLSTRRSGGRTRTVPLVRVHPGSSGAGRGGNSRPGNGQALPLAPAGVLEAHAGRSTGGLAHPPGRYPAFGTTGRRPSQQALVRDPDLHLGEARKVQPGLHLMPRDGQLPLPADASPPEGE